MSQLIYLVFIITIFVSPAGFASANSTTPSCQSLGFAKNEPLAVWNMANKAVLVVCETTPSTQIKENEISGWANVYELSHGKLLPFMDEVNSERGSEVYSFTIKRNDSKNVTVTRFIRSPFADATGESDTPATTFKITCSVKKSSCHKSREICLKSKNTKINKNAITTVENVVAGRTQAISLSGYDIIIGKVIESAIAGDRRALKLILDTPSEKLQTDGAATETLTEGKDLIRRLIGFKCVKY